MPKCGVYQIIVHNKLHLNHLYFTSHNNSQMYGKGMQLHLLYKLNYTFSKKDKFK